MNRWKSIQRIRNKLKEGRVSLGSWMQIPSTDVAEVMGYAGYDWVAVDLEHGSIGTQQLPDIFRALELGGTLPLVRIEEGQPGHCKNALDAGAAGVIVPMVRDKEQIDLVRSACCWPPAGNRGVGFSRANLFGKHFEDYFSESQAPILVAQIEHIHAIQNIADILSSGSVDAVFVGPYDLSASMGLTGKLDHPEVESALKSLAESCKKRNVATGIHVVKPNRTELDCRLKQGYQFVAYSIDAVFLHSSSLCPSPSDFVQ